jgi:MHS family alpha-ketoglutarate permease-like MFS transporter
VIGAVAAVIVFWLRRSMDESAEFEAQPKNRRFQQGSLRELARHPRAVLTVVGLTLGGTVAFYTFTTYLQKFMVNTTGLEKSQVTWINFFALLIFVLLQPIGGLLSDKIGRRPLLIFFGVGTTLLTVPILTALEDATPVTAFLLMLAGLVIVSGYTSINAIVKAELFPTAIRALGVGMPYGVTVAIFGGTAEYVALWLKNAGHESSFYYYVAGCALISLIVYLTMTETRGRMQAQHSSARPVGRPRTPTAQ